MIVVSGSISKIAAPRQTIAGVTRLGREASFRSECLTDPPPAPGLVVASNRGEEQSWSKNQCHGLKCHRLTERQLRAAGTSPSAVLLRPPTPISERASQAASAGWSPLSSKILVA